MKSFIQHILERWFPPIAKWIRFRAIRELPLRSLLSKRLFEPELALMKPLLADTTGLCLDVGAHVGEYCYAMERVVDPSRICAFEPNPATCDLLRRFFPKIHIENIALSDSRGTAKLSVPRSGKKTYATRGTLEHAEGSDDVMEVSLTTLDAFVARINTPLSFVKIDVEGHERKVIVGGMQTILRDHPIMLMEIEERHSAQSITETFKEIEVLGYKGFFLNLRAWKFSPTSSFDVKTMQNVETIKSIDYINNFLFLPRVEADHILARLQQCLSHRE